MSSGVPAAPTGLSGTAVDGVATISFTPPADATSYECSINDGATWTKPKSVRLPDQVSCSGMSNGFGYAIRLRGLNGNGAGIPSERLLVSSVTIPDKPTIFPAAGDGLATISFNPIRWDGGRPITNMEFSLDNGPWVARSPSSASNPVTITGLVNGRWYQVRLRAVNAIGPGLASDPKRVMPISPAAPQPVTVTAVQPADRQLTVTFTLPSASPAGPITNVEYSLDNGDTWVSRSPAATSSPLVITNLVNGRQYLIRLRAVNAAGPGTNAAGFVATPNWR